MAQDRRSTRALATLLPAGAFGLSVSLASADASATATADGANKPKKPGEIAERLQSIRLSVSEALQEYAKDGEPFVAVDPEQQLAWWGNGWRGWHNGGWGWHNGGWGWHNGGWGNGWHNGGWGNGWHNGGWGNGWHNW
jgi:rSAM-associated Gly-rich repeat protein